MSLEFQVFCTYEEELHCLNANFVLRCSVAVQKIHKLLYPIRYNALQLQSRHYILCMTLLFAFSHY